MEYHPLPDTYSSRVYGCSYEIRIGRFGNSYDLECWRHGRVEKRLTFSTWEKARNQIHEWERDGGHAYTFTRDDED